MTFRTSNFCQYETFLDIVLRFISSEVSNCFRERERERDRTKVKDRGRGGHREREEERKRTLKARRGIEAAAVRNKLLPTVTSVQTSHSQDKRARVHREKIVMYDVTRK